MDGGVTGEEDHGHTSCVGSHLCGVEFNFSRQGHFQIAVTLSSLTLEEQRHRGLCTCLVLACSHTTALQVNNAFQMMLLACPISDDREPSRATSGPSYTWDGPGVDLPPTVNWGGFNRRICEIMISRLALYFFVCKIMGFGLNWGRCADVLVKSMQPLPLTSNHKRLW